MKKIFTVISVIFYATTFAQNIGIGEINLSDSKLQIKTTDSAALLLQKSFINTSAKTALLYKNDNHFSGSIATIKTAPCFYRMGMYTYGSSSASGLLERLSITDADVVGIGNIDPAAKFDVAETFKIENGPEGNNKILTSDAAGNASWKSAGSPFGYKKSTQLAPLFGGIFTGDFIVPAIVTEIMVEVGWAGSGGTVVSNVEKSFGGTKVGYAQTVQTVKPSKTCSYSIGVESSKQFASNEVSDGGSTTFNFAGTNITAYGGGGRNANSIQPYQVKSDAGTVSELFLFNDNTRDVPSIDFKQKSSTVFVEIRKLGSDGQTPAIDGAPMPKGGFQYLENAFQTYLINDNSNVNTFPDSGVISIFSVATIGGGNGMILI